MSNSGVAEDSSLFGCSAILTGAQLRAFRRIAVPSSSGSRSPRESSPYEAILRREATATPLMPRTAVYDVVQQREAERCLRFGLF
jgi:hypothetical protein